MPKDLKVYAFFIMKISNNRDIYQIAINHSSYINSKDFINIFKECTAKPYSFLVIDTTLTPDNPLRFRPIFSKEYKN